MLRTLGVVRSALRRLLEAVVILLMVGLAVVVVIAVIYRKAGASLVWYDEIVSVMLAWLTYYAAALAALHRAHLGYSGIVDALPPALRRAAVLVAETSIIAFFLLLGWVGWDVLIVLKGDTLVSLPEVPTQLTQSVIPIGAALFAIAEVLTLPEVLAKVNGSSSASERAQPREQ